jgi:hypothetical protein
MHIKIKIKIKSERDFWSGLAFLVTGAGFSWGATSYKFGNSAQPGPAYFPFGLGILLAILGAFVVFEALTIDTADGGKIGAWGWKPLLWILGAVVFFGWALPLLGMVIALPLLILITARAGDEFHWGEALLNAAILTAGCWAIFTLALKLTIPLWPSFLGN